MSHYEEVRILSNNAYLIPWFFVHYQKWKGDNFSVQTCRDQPQRATRLGALAKEYDILLLQEIWGGASNHFAAPLEKSHQILERNEVYHGLLGTGILADLLNSYYVNILNPSGGLFGGFRNGLKLVWERHHIFQCNLEEEGLNKSVQFMLLDMKSKWPGKFLLTINTHLHSPKPFGNTDERRKQRAEIKDHLLRIQDEENFPRSFEWKNCGVIFVGDFNTAYQFPDGSTTLEYVETVKKAFDVPLRDVFLETHPDNKSHTYDGAGNRYVSCKQDSSRMDFAFFMDQIPSKAGPIEVMKMRGRCDIFKTAKGQDISDHYPLVISLTPAE